MVYTFLKSGEGEESKNGKKGGNHLEKFKR